MMPYDVDNADDHDTTMLMLRCAATCAQSSSASPPSPPQSGVMQPRARTAVPLMASRSVVLALAVAAFACAMLSGVSMVAAQPPRWEVMSESASAYDHRFSRMPIVDESKQHALLYAGIHKDVSDTIPRLLSIDTETGVATDIDFSSAAVGTYTALLSTGVGCHRYVSGTNNNLILTTNGASVSYLNMVIGVTTELWAANGQPVTAIACKGNFVYIGQEDGALYKMVILTNGAAITPVSSTLLKTMLGTHKAWRSIVPKSDDSGLYFLTGSLYNPMGAFGPAPYPSNLLYNSGNSQGGGTSSGQYIFEIDFADMTVAVGFQGTSTNQNSAMADKFWVAAIFPSRDGTRLYASRWEGGTRRFGYYLQADPGQSALRWNEETLSGGDFTGQETGVGFFCQAPDFYVTPKSVMSVGWSSGQVAVRKIARMRYVPPPAPFTIVLVNTPTTTDDTIIIDVTFAQMSVLVAAGHSFGLYKGESTILYQTVATAAATTGNTFRFTVPADSVDAGTHDDLSVKMTAAPASFYSDPLPSLTLTLAGPPRPVFSVVSAPTSVADTIMITVSWDGLIAMRTSLGQDQLEVRTSAGVVATVTVDEGNTEPNGVLADAIPANTFSPGTTEYWITLVNTAYSKSNKVTLTLTAAPVIALTVEGSPNSVDDVIVMKLAWSGLDALATAGTTRMQLWSNGVQKNAPGTLITTANTAANVMTYTILDDSFTVGTYVLKVVLGSDSNVFSPEVTVVLGAAPVFGIVTPTVWSTSNAAGNDLAGIVVDDVGNVLVTSNQPAPVRAVTVLSLSDGQTVLQTMTGFTAGPVSLSFSNNFDKLWVGLDAAPYLVSIDVSAGYVATPQLTTFAPTAGDCAGFTSLSFAWQAAFDNSGNIYVSDFQAGKIYRFDAVTSACKAVFTGMTNPAQMTFSYGRLFTAGITGDVYLIAEPKGPSAAAVLYTSIAGAALLNIQSDSGGNLYVGNRVGAGDSFYRIRPATATTGQTPAPYAGPLTAGALSYASTLTYPAPSQLMLTLFPSNDVVMIAFYTMQLSSDEEQDPNWPEFGMFSKPGTSIPLYANPSQTISGDLSLTLNCGSLMAAQTQSWANTETDQRTFTLAATAAAGDYQCTWTRAGSDLGFQYATPPPFGFSLLSMALSGDLAQNAMLRENDAKTIILTPANAAIGELRLSLTCTGTTSGAVVDDSTFVWSDGTKDAKTYTFTATATVEDWTCELAPQADNEDLRWESNSVLPLVGANNRVFEVSNGIPMIGTPSGLNILPGRQAVFTITTDAFDVVASGDLEMTIECTGGGLVRCRDIANLPATSCAITMPVGHPVMYVWYTAPLTAVGDTTCIWTAEGTAAGEVTPPDAISVHVGNAAYLVLSAPATLTSGTPGTLTISPSFAPTGTLTVTPTCSGGTLDVPSQSFTAGSPAPVAFALTVTSATAETVSCSFALSGPVSHRFIAPEPVSIALGSPRTFTFTGPGLPAGGIGRMAASSRSDYIRVVPSTPSGAGALTLRLVCDRAPQSEMTFVFPQGSSAPQYGRYSSGTQYFFVEYCVWQVSGTEASMYAAPEWAPVLITAPQSTRGLSTNRREMAQQCLAERINGLALPMGGPVSVSNVVGTVRNAATNDVLPGVLVQLRQGATVVTSTTTDASGMYTFANAVPQPAPGTYQVYATLAGFQDYEVEITTIQDQDITINPIMSTTLTAGSFRIVTTWSVQKPGGCSDVDSYLYLPNNGGTVYYSQPNMGGAKLDQDDTSWEGPETVTFASSPGQYRFQLKCYSSRGDLSLDTLFGTDAVVTVYSGSGPTKVFKPSQGEGGEWDVMYIDGVTYEVTPFGGTGR